MEMSVSDRLVAVFAGALFFALFAFFHNFSINFRMSSRKEKRKKSSGQDCADQQGVGLVDAGSALVVGSSSRRQGEDGVCNDRGKNSHHDDIEVSRLAGEGGINCLAQRLSPNYWLYRLVNRPFFDAFFETFRGAPFFWGYFFGVIYVSGLLAVALNKLS